MKSNPADLSRNAMTIYLDHISRLIRECVAVFVIYFTDLGISMAYWEYFNGDFCNFIFKYNKTKDDQNLQRILYC